MVSSSTSWFPEARFFPVFLKGLSYYFSYRKVPSSAASRKSSFVPRRSIPSKSGIVPPDHKISAHPAINPARDFIKAISCCRKRDVREYSYMLNPLLWVLSAGECPEEPEKCVLLTTSLFFRTNRFCWRWRSVLYLRRFFWVSLPLPCLKQGCRENRLFSCWMWAYRQPLC